MGMCKGCGIVFNANDMVGGYCQDCLTDDIRAEAKRKEEQLKSEKELGFDWWATWGWLGIVFGNLFLLAEIAKNEDLATFFGIIILLNTVLMIMVLKFNKYAFLITTLISINPLFWIINGIYLKNRWSHPKVNNGRIVKNEQPTNKKQNFCSNCGKKLNINNKFCPNCGNKIQ